MGALPRPDLAPGPARELNDALHELHHRAGWPSLRTLAHDAGCSHTTVSHVFSSPKLPTWGVLELLVEAMAGSTREFHDLWLAASAPSPNGPARCRASPDDAASSSPYGAISRPAPGSSSSPARPAWARPGSSPPRRPSRATCASLTAPRFHCRGTCRSFPP